jgi:predicted RNA-binding protein associated with RNAse of E/G family
MSSPTLSRATQPPWPAIPLGTTLRIVKLAPDGEEVTNYPGVVVDAGDLPPWIALRATWVSREHNLDGLRFVPGDTLHEFFSPAHWFNLFSVFAPDGTLRGWYANVTYPSRLDTATDPFALFWHDLYVDIVALPDGTVVIRDEDELDEAGLLTTDPVLHAEILAARDELLRRAQARTFPFHEVSW